MPEVPPADDASREPDAEQDREPAAIAGPASPGRSRRRRWPRSRRTRSGTTRCSRRWRTGHGDEDEDGESVPVDDDDETPTAEEQIVEAETAEQVTEETAAA
ncbi:hypothetical protein, partial [Mycolicibacterium insubricum]|uniref:hypothetical protein n=1 Tax=Mycolicibacterium insubricum TaxID=444597 RepID=UPI0021F37416